MPTIAAVTPELDALAIAVVHKGETVLLKPYGQRDGEAREIAKEFVAPFGSRKYPA